MCNANSKTSNNRFINRKNIRISLRHHDSCQNEMSAFSDSHIETIEVLWSMCVVVVAITFRTAMDRLSSWNAIKQTFSPYSRSDSAKMQSKRRKPVSKRKTVSFSVQKTISMRSSIAETSNIEDSDEENVNIVEADMSLTRSKSKKPRLLPLNASIVCSPHRPTEESNKSDSEDVIEASGNECGGKSVEANSSRNPRSEGRQRTNLSIFDGKLKAANSLKKDMINIRNVLDGKRVTIEQAALEDSIIIDTDTDNEDDTGQRSTSVTTTTAMPLSVHLVASNTDLGQPSTEPTIDSVSSFGSFPYQSQSEVAAPIQKSQKRPKVVKGGLTEMLQRSIRKAKSDHAFWLNEKSSTLLAPGERVVIENIERSYGRILVHCAPLDGDEMKIFCLDPESKKLPFLGVGKTIEVEFNTNGYRLDSRTLCYPNVNNFLIL